MIEFLCPEGHKIRCPDEQAGRPAKCPRCGAKFRIPSHAAGGLPESDAGDATVSAPDVTESPLSGSSAGGSGKHAASQDRQIEFLCPNGHHLHGPASLQGRAGECPECGSRFRIPTIEEFDATPPDQENEEIRLGGSGSVKRSTAQQQSNVDESAAEPMSAEVLHSTAAGNSAPSLDLLPEDSESDPGGGHSLGRLFAQLWAAKGEGSRVEVHLDSGGVLLPDGFATTLSQRDHLVLVNNDPDNTYTMTVVPWSTVVRVILRGVEQVPGDVSR